MNTGMPLVGAYRASSVVGDMVELKYYHVTIAPPVNMLLPPQYHTPSLVTYLYSTTPIPPPIP